VFRFPDRNDTHIFTHRSFGGNPTGTIGLRRFRDRLPCRMSCEQRNCPSREDIAEKMYVLLPRTRVDQLRPRPLPSTEPLSTSYQARGVFFQCVSPCWRSGSANPQARIIDRRPTYTGVPTEEHIFSGAGCFEKIQQIHSHGQRNSEAKREMPGMQVGDPKNSVPFGSSIALFVTSSSQYCFRFASQCPSTASRYHLHAFRRTLLQLP